MGTLLKFFVVYAVHGAVNAFVIPAPKAESLLLFSYLRGRAGLWKRTSAPKAYAGEPRVHRTDTRRSFQDIRTERRADRATPADQDNVRERKRLLPDGYGRTYYGGNTMSGNTIQGGSLRTMPSPYHSEQSHVYLGTEGRPLDADFEVWNGPDNTPTKMRVYSEDGRLRPFNAMVRTPYSSGGNTMSVRNTGSLESPMYGGAMPYRPGCGGGRINTANMQDVQGGSLNTWPLDPSVGSVKVSIETDGRPMMAVVELWGVGGHVKQIAEIYNDDGHYRPFSAIVETPGHANTICIRNTGTMTFPIRASVDVTSTDFYH